MEEKTGNSGFENSLMEAIIYRSGMILGGKSQERTKYMEYLIDFNCLWFVKILEARNGDYESNRG